MNLQTSLRRTYAPPILLKETPLRERTARRTDLRTRAQADLLTWEDVEKESAKAPLNGFNVLPPGSRPSTAPGRVLTTSADSVWSAGIDANHPVLLLRDTEAWCPFCERVWLALEWKGVDYDTMFINLRDKPEWFLELAPKGLVPVAKIRDQLVHESFDILKVLEKEFPDPPLLPSDPTLKQETLRLCEGSDDFSSAGYSFLTGGRLGNTSSEEAGASGQGELQSSFEEQLDKLESAIKKYGGPFMMGQTFSMADVVYVSSLERFAATLPNSKGFEMRTNPRYPALGKWYEAMDGLPAYQKVKSDDKTLQMLMRKFFGVKDRHVPEVDSSTKAARLEAAAKMGKNHSLIRGDILNNSGILRVRSNQYGGTLRALNGYPLTPGPALVDAVDHALRRVCHQLIYGTPGERHDCKEACAIGSAALVFFRNRASAPRDLTAAATDQLRAACSEVLLDMF